MCAADLRLPNAACPIWLAGVLRVCFDVGRVLTKIGSRSMLVYIIFPSVSRTVIAPVSTVVPRWTPLAGGPVAGVGVGRPCAGMRQDVGDLLAPRSPVRPPAGRGTGAHRLRQRGDRLHDRPGSRLTAPPRTCGPRWGRCSGRSPGPYGRWERPLLADRYRGLGGW